MVVCSSQFLLVFQRPLKMTHTIKMVKIDSIIIFLLPLSKSMKHTVGVILIKIYNTTAFLFPILVIFGKKQLQQIDVDVFPSISFLIRNFFLFWHENRNSLFILRFEGKNRYILSKFVLKFNLKPLEIILSSLLLLYFVVFVLSVTQ